MEVSRKVKALAGVAEDAAEDALLEAAHVARRSQHEEEYEEGVGLFEEDDFAFEEGACESMKWMTMV